MDRIRRSYLTTIVFLCFVAVGLNSCSSDLGHKTSAANAQDSDFVEALLRDGFELINITASVSGLQVILNLGSAPPLFDNYDRAVLAYGPTGSLVNPSEVNLEDYHNNFEIYDNQPAIDSNQIVITLPTGTEEQYTLMVAISVGEQRYAGIVTSQIGGGFSGSGGPGPGSGVPPTVGPADFFVKKNATGLGNCLSAANACTLDDVQAVVQPGSLVDVIDFTNTDIDVDNSFTKGAAGSPIIYRRAGNSELTSLSFTGTTGNNSFYLAFEGFSIRPPINNKAIEVKGMSHITVRNCDIQGVWNSQNGFFVQYSVGVLIKPISSGPAVHHVSIEGCIMRDLGVGVQIEGANHNITVTHSTIDHILGSHIRHKLGHVNETDASFNNVFANNHLSNQDPVYIDDPDPDGYHGSPHGSCVVLRDGGASVMFNILRSCGNSRGINVYPNPDPVENIKIVGNLLYSILNYYAFKLPNLGGGFELNYNTVIGKYNVSSGNLADYFSPVTFGVHDDAPSGILGTIENNIIVGQMHTSGIPSQFTQKNNIVYSSFLSGSWVTSLPNSLVIVSNNSPNINPITGQPFIPEFFEQPGGMLGQFFTGGSNPTLFWQHAFDPDTPNINISDGFTPAAASYACNGELTGDSDEIVGAIPCS